MLKDNHCLSQPSSLSPPSQVMMGIRTFSFLETTKSPPSSLFVPLLFPTAAEDSTTPFILSISPTSTVLTLLSASPLGFYCLTHAPPKGPENVLLKHILPSLQTSQFLTGS